jgi:hypothetical protein
MRSTRIERRHFLDRVVESADRRFRVERGLRDVAGERAADRQRLYSLPGMCLRPRERGSTTPVVVTVAGELLPTEPVAVLYAPELGGVSVTACPLSVISASRVAWSSA